MPYWKMNTDGTNSGDISMDIYVGNLPYQADDQKLQELFAKHGTVTSARVIMDKHSGDSKGFGFVEMPDKREALEAIQATNEKDFMGRSLRVNESQPKPRGGTGGYGGGNSRDRW
jgi:RNA recognition motif-containing protein